MWYELRTRGNAAAEIIEKIHAALLQNRLRTIAERERYAYNEEPNQTSIEVSRESRVDSFLAAGR